MFSRPDYAASLSPSITLDEHEMVRGSMRDSFLGCPELLLRAIRFISTERDTVAAMLQNKHSEYRRDHEVHLAAMLDLVEKFEFHESPFNLHYGESSFLRNQQETQRRHVLSEVYKLGTLIYGKRVLSALTEPGISFNNDVSRLLELLDMLREDRESLKCVLWPVFVTGLECTSPRQRQHFVTHLEEFWMTTKCLNAVNAAKILQDHWKRDGQEAVPWPFDSGRFGRLWLFM